MLFSTSYYFHRNMFLFLIYFSPSDGTTFISCLVAQSSSHHQYLDHSCWLLWDPVRQSSIRHNMKWHITCFASVRMTLNSKWSEEKLKLKLILIPSNLFLLIFNTYNKKEKYSKNMSKTLAVQRKTNDCVCIQAHLLKKAFNNEWHQELAPVFSELQSKQQAKSFASALLISLFKCFHCQCLDNTKIFDKATASQNAVLKTKDASVIALKISGWIYHLFSGCQAGLSEFYWKILNSPNSPQQPQFPPRKGHCTLSGGSAFSLTHQPWGQEHPRDMGGTLGTFLPGNSPTTLHIKLKHKPFRKKLKSCVMSRALAKPVHLYLGIKVIFLK